MNKNIINILVAISSITYGFSQSGTLTLENGKRISYEKIKINTNSFLVTKIINGKKVKKTISTDSIKSYEEVITTFYKKPNTLGGTRKYDFVKREVTGKINVYHKKVENYVSGQYGGYVVSSDYIYLEKGDRYELLFIPNSLIKNKKEKIQILKSFIEDDSEILAKVESDDFKVRFEDVIKIIKLYNTNSYKSKN